MKIAKASAYAQKPARWGLMSPVMPIRIRSRLKSVSDFRKHPVSAVEAALMSARSMHSSSPRSEKMNSLLSNAGKGENASPG